MTSSSVLDQREVSVCRLLRPNCDLSPIRPRGPQRPGWPNSQLPFRNLLPYDAQTLWLLAFAIKTCSIQTLAKLVSQGGCCCSFLIKMSRKFWKWKNFPLLENCWNWHGESILGRKERISTWKLIFLKLNPFAGGKYPSLMTCSGKLCDVISPKLEKLPDSNFASGMLSWL